MSVDTDLSIEETMSALSSEGITDDEEEALRNHLLDLLDQEHDKALPDDSEESPRDPEATKRVQEWFKQRTFKKMAGQRNGDSEKK